MYVCIPVHICMCTCMYVYMHVLYVYIICMFTCMCVCVCVCVYLFLHPEKESARASMHVCTPVAPSIIQFVHPQSIRTQRCTAPSVDKASRKGAACEGKELGVADGARLVLVDLSEERH